MNNVLAPPLQISILSTGTELTTGQIVNKNSAWLAAELKKLGLDSKIHLTVPDDRQLILKAIDFCLQQTDVLLVTGGLGPTTDDFTRDLIAEYFKEELIFNQDSWHRILEILSKRQIQPKESQKQQCFFPKGSVILTNALGTANGFQITKKSKTIIALPGPPIEIEAIWQNHLKTWFQENTEHMDKAISYAWETLGIPESEVAAIVEASTVDLKKDFPFDIGYRVHLPYVEVKISYPKSVDFTALVYKEKIDQALKNITVLKNFEKANDLFFNIINQRSFAFYDFVTDGQIHKSLSDKLSLQKNWHWKQTTDIHDSDFFNEEENFLALMPIDEKTIFIQADLDGLKWTKKIECPARISAMKMRRDLYFAELSLIEFIRNYTK